MNCFSEISLIAIIWNKYKIYNSHFLVKFVENSELKH